MFKSRIFLIFVISCYLLTEVGTANLSVSLTVQNSDSFDGPQNMGINMVSFFYTYQKKQPLSVLASQIN
jgi:hypothetical protein